MSTEKTQFTKDNYEKALDAKRNWSSGVWQTHLAKVIQSSGLTFENYEKQIVEKALSIGLSEEKFIINGQFSGAEINLCLLQNIFDSKQQLKKFDIQEDTHGNLTINFAQECDKIFAHYLNDETSPNVITADEAALAKEQITTLEQSIQNYYNAINADREHLSESIK